MSDQRNDINNTKISGYLEKKSKLKIKSWKKYWYVLEGRLLLYYRSKEEYDSISPCKGSINLCPPCNIIPTSNLTNAFQIETRGSNNVILRAPDRHQQEKWMQAILTVLKQNSSSSNNDKKRIECRYSNDDLVKNNPFNNNNKYNTASNDINIIERIKTIGGQSYGGSLGAINKVTESMLKKANIPQSQSLVKLLQNKNVIDKRSSFNDGLYIRRPILTRSVSDNRTRSLLIDNEFYDVKFRENTTEHLYERISQDYAMAPTVRSSIKSEIFENDHYNLSDVRYNNNNVDFEYDYISRETIQIKDGTDVQVLDYVTAKDEEEPEYALAEAEYASAQDVEYASTEEAEYAVVTKSKHSSLDRDVYVSKESEYALAEYDVTKSAHVLISEDELIRKEPKYAVPAKKTDRNKNSVILDNDLYDTCENIKVNYDVKGLKDNLSDSRDVLYEEPEIVMESKVSKKIKKRHSITQSLRMSALRVSKIWQKRRTKKEVNVEPTTMTTTAVHEDMNTVEVLKELQKIVENKKNEIEEKARKSQHFHNGNEDNKETNPGSSQTPNNNDSSQEADYDPPANNKPTTELVPELPPHKHQYHHYHHHNHQRQAKDLSPIYDVPRNNCPVLFKKKNRKSNNIGNIKTIDEILENLDKESANINNNDDNKPSVRELIEKFDDKSQVVLRKKLTQRPRSNIITSMELKYEDEDDLNKLLEELSKITNAPILTPGITNSLNVPNTSKEEWFDFNPRVNRRNSDPDYDIPRSHKPPQHLLTTSELLINNYVKCDDDDDDYSERRSYFCNDDTDYSTDSDVFVHPIDPDSLEVDLETRDLNTNHSNYVQSTRDNNNIYENNFNFIKYENVRVDRNETIYAKPRLLFTTENMDSVERTTMESYGETSTIF